MDQIALVEKQFDDGRRLIERLSREGFPVTAGGWVKTDDDSQWYLYLVSPVMDDEGPLNAYGRVHPVIRQMMQQDDFWIDPFEVKVIGPTEPLAVALADLHRQSPGRHPIRYGSTSLGGVGIEGAFIYPPIHATAR